ncbi:MAG: hypothetical protein LBQ54_01655 [Planctomycetaceae bacterium]|jgi:hypothetical protein|nr:hypothetical protein [Planctomycetaceae bacterium]
MLKQTDSHHYQTPERKGAALIIALVLLLFVSALSAAILRQVYNGRLEMQRQIVHVQTDQLVRDFVVRAEQRLAFDPSYTGGTVTFTNLTPRLPGTFQLVTHVESSAGSKPEITVTAEYRGEDDRTVYVTQNSLPLE